VIGGDRWQDVSELAIKIYLVISFSLVVKSVKKFIQDMMMDLNSSRFSPTPIGRPIRCD